MSSVLGGRGAGRRTEIEEREERWRASRPGRQSVSLNRLLLAIKKRRLGKA